MLKIEPLLSDAVRHFWATRTNQAKAQGSKSGKKDMGSRAAVTGGKHADGFVRMIAAIVADAGLPDVEIFTAAKNGQTLPGYFRPTKTWDLVVVHHGNLVAVVEVKSQVGSFGNNFNNRVEEALGNATDFWAAYKMGTYQPSQRPWLGYLLMLEEDPVSTRPRRKIQLPYFQVDEAFQKKSYLECYREVCTRLVRERLYDACCFFSSSRAGGLRGKYSEPAPEIGAANFAISLHARAAAFARTIE